VSAGRARPLARRLFGPGRRRDLIIAVVALITVWVLLWGVLSWANLISGLVVAIIVLAVFPLPPAAFAGRFRPLGLLRFAARFLTDLVRASVQLSVLALRFGHQPRSAIIRVPLRAPSELILTLTGEAVSLVPGSLIVDTDQATSAPLHPRHRSGRPGRGGAVPPRRLRGRGPDRTGHRLQRRDQQGRHRRADPPGRFTMIIVAATVTVLLCAAVLLVLARLVRGPTTLDRIVAVDVLLAIVVCAIAAEAAYTRDATSLPILVGLSVLGFIGSVTVGRFAPRGRR
jgi:multicomponent Na+:H+ antiporter subunit E